MDDVKINEIRKRNTPEPEKIWDMLAKYNIHSERDLKVAIKKMKPLDIGLMVNSSDKIIKSKNEIVNQ